MSFLKNNVYLIVLIILITLPFLPILIFNRFFVDTGVLYSDMTNFYYSLKVWYQTKIQNGQFPFWTDYMANGYPIFAEGELGALYPLNLILYFFLPVTLAFNLNLFLHFLLAAISSYFFGKISLKLSNYSSLLLGIAYPFCGFFFAHLSYIHMIFIISYLPLTLLIAERIVNNLKLKYIFILALIFSSQIFVGYTEIFYYNFIVSFLFLFLLIIFQKEEERKVKYFSNRIFAVLIFFSATILSLGISSVQVLNNYEVIKYSHREGGLNMESATASNWPLQSLSLFINPHAFDNYQAKEEYHPNNPSSFSIPTVYGYVGFLTLIFALISLIQFKKKRYLFIFTLLIVFVFLWAQGQLSSLFSILFNVVPLLSYFRTPVKLLFALSFFLIVLSGFGFDFLLEKLKTKNKSLLSIISIGVIFIIYLDLIWNNYRFQPQTDFKKWISKPESVSFLEKNFDKNLFQIYSHGTNNLDYPTAKDLSLQKDFQNMLPPDLNMAFGLPANRETIALFMKDIKILNAPNATLDLENGLLGLNNGLKRSLEIQGVKYLLSDLPINSSDLTLIKEFPFNKPANHRGFLKNGEIVKIPVNKTYLYESNFAVPRINFVTKSIIAQNHEDALIKIYQDNFNPKEEIIIEGFRSASQSIEENDQELNKEIKVLENNEDKQLIKIKTNQSGFLVLTKTFYPGWQAFVDGQKTLIYKANFAFSAIKVAKGEHEIKFVFEPTYWRIGGIISLVSLLSTIVGFILSTKLKLKENE